MNKNTRQCARGFTLTELLVVIAIIGLICSMGGMIYKSMYRVSARSEVDLLHTTLHYLRARALATGTPQTLTFNIANNTYDYDTVTHTLAGQIVFACDESLLGPPADPHSPITSCCSFKDNRLIISAEGIAQPGTIYLTDQVSSRVYALSSAVSHYSFFRKYEYDKGWHFLE